MTLYYILGGIALWYAIGVFGLIMDWTEDLDLTLPDFMVVLVCAIMGPFSLIMWGCSASRTKVILKQRKTKR